MIPSYKLSDIERLKPCRDRWAKVKALKLGRGAITAKQAVAAGVSFDDLLWVVSVLSCGEDKQSIDIKFRMTGWMADVAAHVLHIFEKQYPNDDRPRLAIEASQSFIRGDITEAERAAGAAWAAGAAEAARAARAAEAAGAAEAAEAEGAAEAAEAEGAAEAAEAAWAAEHQWQFDRLVYWLSEEKPKFWPLPDKQNAKESA